MIFANVKDIKIPEGNIKKIHEKDTGRVLWEKKTSPTYEAGYPKVGVLIQTSDYGNVWAGDSGIVTPYINKWAHNGTILTWANSEYSYQIKNGNILTAYGFYNSSETEGHLITDAVWSYSDFYCYPRTGGNIGPVYYVMDDENPGMLNKVSGSVVLISKTSIPSLVKGCKLLSDEGYNSKNGYSKVAYKFYLYLSSITLGIANKLIAEFGSIIENV